MMNGAEIFTAPGALPLWQTLAAAGVLTAAFYGAGKLLLKAFPKENFTAFALGGALFMTLFALLPPSRGVLLAVTLPFAVWGVREVLPVIKGNPGMSCGTGVLFLFFLGSALLPPYAWDEQTYQLALPLRYLQTGSFAPCPDNPYSYYPAFTGWFFANAIALGGLEVPRILVGFITPLLLTAVWRLTAGYGKLAACSAVAAFFISPLVLNMNRAVYVENFIALFTTAGLFAAWKMRKKVFFAPVVCGILAGAAFAVKPTGALGSVLLLSLFMLKIKEWKKLICFCGTAFLFSFFWYLRTWLYTGNFFYPYAFFPLPGSVEHFHGILGSARYGLEGAMGIALNWLFAGFDKKLFDGIVTGFHLPLLGCAALAGIYFLSKKHPRFIRFTVPGTSALLLVLIVWSALFPQSRFILFLLPVAAAGGIAVITLSPFKKFFAALLGAVMVCTVIFQSFPFLKHYVVSWRILPYVRSNPAGALAVLARDPGLFRAFELLDQQAPKDARCLLLMERRGLYCPRPWNIACPGFEPSLTPVPESSEKLFEKLHHYDYIIVGSTTQDVDLQSANMEDCKKIFELLNELIKEGKVEMLDSPGYPVLKVKK